MAFDKPIYGSVGFEEPIILFEGQSILHGNEDIQGVGQIAFKWRPKPQIIWQFSTNKIGNWDILADDLEGGKWLEPTNQDFDSANASVASLWGDRRPADHHYYDDGRQPNHLVLGRSSGFTAVQIQVVNFVDHIPDHQPLIETDFEEWRVTMTRRSTTKQTLKSLQEFGGYGFTHVVQIERLDKADFGFDDIEEIVTALWLLLSFAASSRVGLALATGLDVDGHPVGTHQRIQPVDSFVTNLSWFDPFHAQDLCVLLSGILGLKQDPFWSGIIARSIRGYLAASTADPVEEAIVTALSALELLSWAVLQIDERWINLPQDGKLNLAGQLRLLLRWANIDPAVPPQLIDLVRLVENDQNIIDGPAVITWVRNRSVHPPKMKRTGKPAWPTSDELADTWRLSLEYLNLIILRLLGHTGEYGSVLHVNGRWRGEMTPVPWNAPLRSSSD